MAFNIMKYFNDERYSMREIRVKIAEEVIKMNADERKQCVDECNRMIAEANAEADSICAQQGNLPSYEYPDEVHQVLAGLGKKVAYLGGISYAMIFPQLYA